MFSFMASRSCYARQYIRSSCYHSASKRQRASVIASGRITQQLTSGGQSYSPPASYLFPAAPAATSGASATLSLAVHQLHTSSLRPLPPSSGASATLSLAVRQLHSSSLRPLTAVQRSFRDVKPGSPLASYLLMQPLPPSCGPCCPHEAPAALMRPLPPSCGPCRPHAAPAAIMRPLPSSCSLCQRSSRSLAVCRLRTGPLPLLLQPQPQLPC
jgi:hypothetical protein